MEAWRLTAGHNNVFTWKRSLDSNASHSSSVEVPCTAKMTLPPLVILCALCQLAGSDPEIGRTPTAHPC